MCMVESAASTDRETKLLGCVPGYYALDGVISDACLVYNIEYRQTNRGKPFWFMLQYPRLLDS